jgi:hypothetical protein
MGHTGGEVEAVAGEIEDFSYVGNLGEAGVKRPDFQRGARLSGVRDGANSDLAWPETKRPVRGQ